MLQLDNYYFPLKKASEEATIEPLLITSNGTYTVPEKTAYSPITVEVYDVVDERFKQILEGTITEINDNTITTVRKYAQYFNEKLTSVNLPNVTSIGDCAFMGCYYLSSLNIPNATFIDDSAFSNCKNALNTIDFPFVTIVGSQSFANCKKLKSVNLPKVTSFGHYTFEHIAADTLDFPSLIEIKGNKTFQRCSNLITFILRSTTLCSLSNTDTFYETPIADSTEEGFIYVPDELVEDYKVATNWVELASKIKPISELPAEE